MAASTAAQQAEKNAYNKLHKLLGNPKAFAEPAGFETAFPDFGFTLMIDKSPVDLHIEYKADAKAQMGSMRDWIFDGKKFTSNDTSNEDKKDMLEIMSMNKDCVNNGKRLLSDLKEYFDKRVTKLYSGVLTVVQDKQERRAKLINFTQNTKNYQLANIDDTSMGDLIISHYKNKFKKSRIGNNPSALMMMIANELWIVEKTSNLSQSSLEKVYQRLEVDKLNYLNNLKAKLEVRIQPRGLSSPGKPNSIDVMASFRLSGKPSGGVAVI
jgi:hypothetical protein